jgi:hypothetical protein
VKRNDQTTEEGSLTIYCNCKKLEYKCSGQRNSTVFFSAEGAMFSKSWVNGTELTSDTLVGEVGKAVFWFHVSFGQCSNIIEADSCIVTGEFPDMFSPCVV